MEKTARYPTVAEQITAANTPLKWNMAMLLAEDAFDRNKEKPEPIALVVRSDKITKTKKWARLADAEASHEGIEPIAD